MIGRLRVGAGGGPVAHWQAWRSRRAAAPVRLVIAFPPGGPVDFVARILAEGLGKELGTTVIVDNKPGGNGAISAQAVINAKPDGNTLWFTSAGAAAINPVAVRKAARTR